VLKTHLLSIILNVETVVPLYIFVETVRFFSGFFNEDKLQKNIRNINHL